MVVMLTVSTIALGTIKMSSKWSGEGDVWGYYASSEATATASGGQQTEYSHAYGSWSLLTTEECDCDWWYYIEANAWAEITYEEEFPAWAYGEGGASVDLTEVRSPGFFSVPAGASIDDEDCDDPPDWKYSSHTPNPMSASNTDHFAANDAIYAFHEVAAEAWIYEGSDNETMGWGDAGASIDLDESE